MEKKKKKHNTAAEAHTDQLSQDLLAEPRQILFLEVTQVSHAQQALRAKYYPPVLLSALPHPTLKFGHFFLLHKHHAFHIISKETW